MSNSPDLVLTNADVITMNPDQPRAEAVAVADGKIVAVGSSLEIAAMAGTGTQIVDLGGGVLSPGFVEPHSHVLLMAMLLAPAVTDVRAFVAPTWVDVSAKIDQAIRDTEPGKPVIVFGLDTIVHDCAMPTGEELNARTREHPLIVISMSGHTAVANSAAYALAGITAETPDPPGGRFARADDGSVTGLADEASAVAMLAEPLLLASGFDVVASVRVQAATLAEAGFTTIGELLVQDRDFPLLEAMKQMPDLPIRMRLYEMTNATLKPTGHASNDAGIRQIGLKLWVDGTPLEGKSLHNEPFIESKVTRQMGLPPECCGSANYSEEELLTIARGYVGSGLQMAAHAQGDGAVDRILNVYEKVLIENELVGTDHRWRVEHCGGMTKEQFERAATLGVTCSMFPRHVYYFGDVYVDSILGPERGSHWMSLRSAIDSGIRVSLHNDGYFTPPEPIGSMYTATTRIAKNSGRVLAPEERITVDEAFRAVTINAAWHLFSEHEVGSIEVGKFADFAELSTDPYTVAPTELVDKVVVNATWIGGRKVDLDALRPKG